VATYIQVNKVSQNLVFDPEDKWYTAQPTSGRALGGPPALPLQCLGQCSLAAQNCLREHA